jgi:protocatechuate 3,4-dioxygenase beta subunit
MWRLLLLTLLVPFAGSQQPSRATVDGLVIKLGSGEALPDATVELSLSGKSDDPRFVRPGQPPDFHRKATTDRNGRFIFENVIPGQYQLVATYAAGGYVPAEYGQRSPTGKGIDFEIVTGQRMSGIQLVMSPTGTISGRIYDRDGEPLGKAQVQALRAVYENGRRTLTIVQAVQTDDRGEYRLFWLAPGRYYVSAKPNIPELPVNPGASNSGLAPAVRITNPARFGTYSQASSPIIEKRRLKSGQIVEETYLTTYYPGTIEVQSAMAMDVPPAATVGGIDFSVGAGLMPTHHIRGRVIDSKTGQPATGGTVFAVPQTPEPATFIARATMSPEGLFDVGGAVAGSYALIARTQSGSAITKVDVGDRDVANIPMLLTSGYTLTGRFIVDGRSRTGQELQPSSLRVDRLIRDVELFGFPSPGPSFAPPPAADGSFRLEGVSPGDFRLSIRGLPPDAYIKSIRMANTDVLNDGLHLYSQPENPLEIVVGANAGRIEGSVVNARRETVANRVVVLVPDVRLRQRRELYKVVSTDTAGQFRLQGITPGSYTLFAWENVEPGAWQDSDFIRTQEARGTPIQVVEGGNENIQLNVIP